jgi:hypothetical protein
MECVDTGEEVEPEEGYDFINHRATLSCPACGETLDPETLETVSSGNHKTA